MMTRQHFELIAEILNEGMPPADDVQRREDWIEFINKSVIWRLKGENPRFDAAKFRKACGL